VKSRCKIREDDQIVSRVSAMNVVSVTS